MVDYEALYKVLFNGMTDAVRELERLNFGTARVMLISAQQTAEDIFISDEGDVDDKFVGADSISAPTGLRV